MSTEKKFQDRRPMSNETTRSAPDVIIVSKPIRWGWPSGPPPWAPTPPRFYEAPREPRTCPEGSYQPHSCCDNNLSKSVSFDNCEGYYSQHFDEGPKLIYDYCLKSDFKSKTLPRNVGSSVDVKKIDSHRSVCFYGVDDSPSRSRKFIVKADIEPPR